MYFASLLVAPLLPPPPAAAAWGKRARATPPRFVLAASCRGGDPAPPTFERLREQLLQLHAEANLTQSKANSTRVRLVRLTEAAENLKKRATVSVRMGKERGSGLRACLAELHQLQIHEKQIQIQFSQPNTSSSSSSTMDLLHENSGSTPRSTKSMEHLKGCSTKLKFDGVGENYPPCH